MNRLAPRLAGFALVAGAAHAGLLGPGARALTVIPAAPAAEIIPWPSAAQLRAVGINPDPPAPAGDDELARFMEAIRTQESGGNYNAVNRSSGARGAYQIMPANWPVWTVEAGLPADAPWTPENQDRVAAHKMAAYHQQFGSWEDVATAWFAGPGRVGQPGAGSLSDGLTTVADYVAIAMGGMR